MGDRFPAANYKDIIKVAKKCGFCFCRQAKGSHEIWRRNSDGRQTTIPKHNKKVVKRRTLKAILSDLQISLKEFTRLKRK